MASLACPGFKSHRDPSLAPNPADPAHELVARHGDRTTVRCRSFFRAGARDNLAEALALFFETAPAEETNRRLHGEVYVTQIQIAVG